MREHGALQTAAGHAAAFIENLPGRPVAPGASLAELRAALGKPLADAPMDAAAVIDELVRDADGGLMGSAGSRFFGWVIGGSVPAALAADWLTSAWDQNAGMYACSPAAAVVEEVAGEWLKELLGIPAGASFGFVTGCQMASTTALAAARHRILQDRGWDVAMQGLCGAPRPRVLMSRHRHESIIRAVRFLGLGSDAIEIVDCSDSEGISVAALAASLDTEPGRPAIVCLSAGDVNAGLFDPLREACEVAHAHGAWVHIDGAFGLWAAATKSRKHLLDGAELADSWATDAHKWLNVPYDSGLVFVADPGAHRAGLEMRASYLVSAGDARDQIDWNPEFSRRARGFAVYAAMRSLGRRGVEEIVDRCCDAAAEIVAGIGALDGTEVLATPVVNQGLVRFLAPDGDHDRWTEEIVRRLQASGVAWFGATTWNGARAMRVSVSNWQTTPEDVALTLESVRECCTLAKSD
jgi:glutamate/tyrosine decarboxylase-like PLP-dependent enzyme